MEILVLGCGVIGLTSAIKLAEAGHAVEIWAKSLPPETTSNRAAAIWQPYLASPEALVKRWGKRTFEEFCHAAYVNESGVVMTRGREYRRKALGVPWWSESVRDFRTLTPHELPPGRTEGFEFTTPVIDMSVYLTDFLMPRFLDLGGVIKTREVKTLAEALAHHSVVIHCTGLGARELASDPTVYAVRGQTVRISPKPVSEFAMEDDHPEGMVYVIPRLNDCILGGISETGNESLVADEATAKAIFRRCGDLEPRLLNSSIGETRVGLRPARPTVRLELETFGEKIVIHNYGHGGSGVTLCWGCAEDVQEQLDRWRGSPG